MAVSMMAVVKVLEVCLATLLVLAFWDFKVNTKMVQGKAENLRRGGYCTVW